MAEYAYRCAKDHVTIVQRSITAEEKIPACNKCGAPTRRMFAAPPIVFRGTGWGKD